METLKVSSFNYFLPPELIAQNPTKERDQSRLLVLDKKTGNIEHKIFAQVVDYLTPNDVLIINNAKVIPARLYGQKKTGGKVEILLLHKIADSQDSWEALITDFKKFKVQDKIYFRDENLEAEIIKKEREGKVALSFKTKDFEKILHKIGKMPLPPYIKREATDEDWERYQTIFALKSGAVAAPTAGLHFTLPLLDKIITKGIKIVPITLYVGWGTFAPVREEDITKHKMETEFYEISQESAEAINKAIVAGKNVVSVGTTVVRALESSAMQIRDTSEVARQYRDSCEVAKPVNNWRAKTGTANTDIFIYPGYEFKIVKKLITNFHLPKSTLLMLVSAFAGTETIRRAYQVAIEEKYRFYSYGDAMYIK